MIEEIIKRFSSYWWHDSRIINIQLTRRTDGDKEFEDIACDFELLFHATPEIVEYKRTKLIFKDCFLLKSYIYLVDKRYCSDMIEDAICMDESELKSLAISELGKNASEYLYFKIDFVAPGGEIELLAKDFEIIDEK